MAEQNTNTNLITAKDIEKALLEVLNTAIRQKFKTDGKFIKDHLGYVKKIRTAEKPERYVRYIARKFILDEVGSVLKRPVLGPVLRSSVLNFGTGPDRF